MTRFRINGQGRLMSYGLDMWTTLPPKRAKFELFCMERAALIALYTMFAVVAALPAHIAVYA